MTNRCATKARRTQRCNSISRWKNPSFIERVNEPFLAAGGSGEQFRAGIERAVALGWLWRHESGSLPENRGGGAVCLIHD
jgi:hypothetical protein